MLPLLLTILAVSAEPTENVLPEQTARAQAFLDALLKGDFKAAAKDFNADVQKALPDDKLEKTWQSIIKQFGPLKKRTDVRVEKTPRADVVYLTCEFENGVFDFKVAFDKDKLIMGFFLAPPKKAYDFKPPAYAKPDAYTEKSLVVGSGDWPLPATLTLPKGDGPFPGVVLVHGSGPHDGDETIGPNKPFRDLAWGLASQGVAVLRYEKRTHKHGPAYVALKNPTFKDEVIDDALAALALMREQKGVDPKRIFLLGHSLGAYLGPKIASADDHLAGLILLAGNTRKLEDVVLEQFGYIYSLNESDAGKIKEQLADIQKKVAKAKEADLSLDTPRQELPIGINASYWLWMRDYDPAASAAKLTLPILALQGERDYQVTMDDFAGWKKALESHKNAKAISYPRLNHLFMEGVGKAKPAEYDVEGHVAKQVVDDIAGFVKSH